MSLACCITSLRISATDQASVRILVFEPLIASPQLAERREREGMEKEIELGVDLIDRLTSEEFHPKNYQDEY